MYCASQDENQLEHTRVHIEFIDLLESTSPPRSYLPMAHLLVPPGNIEGFLKEMGDTHTDSLLLQA